MKSKIYVKVIIIIFTAFLNASCTKNVPKEMLNNQNSQNNPHTNQQPGGQENSSGQDQRQMPDDSIHRSLTQNNTGNNTGSDTTQGDLKGDSRAELMVKEADDAEALYQKTKSDSDKKICVNKQLSAANYLMFEANLSPKKKYRTALQRYRRVLELDPVNTEAAANKKQIEDIYQSMGMPVPN